MMWLFFETVRIHDNGNLEQGRVGDPPSLPPSSGKKRVACCVVGVREVPIDATVQVLVALLASSRQ